MGAAAAEPASPPLSSPPLRRQRSVASAIVSRCCNVLCCYDVDHFFTPLTPSPKDSNLQAQQQRQAQAGGTWHDNWRLLGSRRARITVPGPCDAEVVLSDEIYPKPARWRILFRKLRAETRRMNCSRPSPPGFHYDALSYAMNFDDGSWQQQSLYRSSSPAVMESFPTSTKLTVSSMS